MQIRRLTGTVLLRIRTSRPGLYADALVNMRARQVLYRLRRLVPMRLLACAVREREPWAWRPLAGGLGVDPAPHSGAVAAPEAGWCFSAVGRRRPFVDSACFWQPGDDGLLFAFHLHGFSDLARYAHSDATTAGDAFWGTVIESWLEHQSTPNLPGWHPYPTSGRIIAWCAALSRGGWPGALEARMLCSLTRQARVLGRSIEHDIGGNHVLRNAAGLLVGGICLGHGAHERRALRLLERELSRQILSDGGHEERSTAYHRAVLADVDDTERLLGRAGRGTPGWLARSRQAMRAWESEIRGPDGLLPLLNDAWEGPAAPAAPRSDLTPLLETGYVIVRHDDDQAVFDVGPVAPRHLPPHAHADVMSFVLWGDGRPIIVDPGSFSYSGPHRRAFRSTSSHNTVEVDGLDQCELWGDFRAALMPKVLERHIERRGTVTIVAASHDGYRRLADPVVHRRTFVWLPGDGLVIVDTLDADSPHQVRSRLHLAPGLSGSSLRAGPFQAQPLATSTAVRTVAGEYSPYLGVKERIEVLECAMRVRPHAPFGWCLLRPGARAAVDDGALHVVRSDGTGFVLELRR
ncbi:MAG: heparinase II/III family protein [Chloroflexota bacterium]|nr:heparinase II/III family protein [Chloroflexota bacterium]